MKTVVFVPVKIEFLIILNFHTINILFFCRSQEEAIINRIGRSRGQFENYGSAANRIFRFFNTNHI